MQPTPVPAYVFGAASTPLWPWWLSGCPRYRWTLWMHASVSPSRSSTCLLSSQSHCACFPRGRACRTPGRACCGRSWIGHCPLRWCCRRWRTWGGSRRSRWPWPSAPSWWSGTRGRNSAGSARSASCKPRRCLPASWGLPRTGTAAGACPASAGSRAGRSSGNPPACRTARSASSLSSRLRSTACLQRETEFGSAASFLCLWRQEMLAIAECWCLLPRIALKVMSGLA